MAWASTLDFQESGVQVGILTEQALAREIATATVVGPNAGDHGRLRAVHVHVLGHGDRQRGGGNTPPIGPGLVSPAFATGNCAVLVFERPALDLNV